MGGVAGGNLIGCQVLQGVQHGFCGCLTTVSTWVVELHSLRRKHAYFYGTASVRVALSSLGITAIINLRVRVAWSTLFVPSI